MNIAAYPQYENYRESYRECLDFPIPSHWSNEKVRFLFRFNKGLTITKENLQDEGIPCINYGEIHSKFGFEVDPRRHDLKCVSPEYLKANKGSLLRRGDFVFADTSEDIEGSGNFTHLDSDEPTFAGYHTLIARPLEKAQTRYLAYMLDSTAFRKQVQKSVKGVKVYSISQGLLKNLEILQPPVPEQRSIAAFLDSKCARIDEAVRIKEEQITLLRERRQILIQQALTRGLNSEVPMKDSGIDWIGEIPEHWEKSKLKHVVDTWTGYAFPSSAFVHKGIPVIRIGDLIAWGNVTTEKAVCLPECYMSFDKQFGVCHGDILMAMTGGTIGKVSVYASGKPALLNQRVCAFRPKHDFPLQLALYWMQTRAWQQHIFLNAEGGAQPNISDKAAIEMQIVLPYNQSEVLDIMRYIQIGTEKVKNAISIKQDQIAKLKEYKTTLINAAVTGKIKVS